MPRLWLALVLAGVCAGCEYDILAAHDAVEYTPPSWYRTAWQEMETCTGLHGARFESVTWVRAAEDYVYYKGHWYRGLAYVQQNVIVIGHPFIDGGYLVRHEIVHLLARAPGHDGDYIVGSRLPQHGGEFWTCPGQYAPEYVPGDTVYVCLGCE